MSLTSKNVIVRKGSLPLIITAPHGGFLKPNNIPDRVRNGSLLLADMYTQEIAEGIEHALYTHYRARPSIVLNQVSRRKADMNRSLKEGTETKIGEKLWLEYHQHINDCIEHVQKRFEYGIILDIHGHTHVDNMVELGYLLRPEELESDFVNKYIQEKSSIQSLVKRSALNPQEVVQYLGKLMMANSRFIVTPSDRIPVPQNPRYFSGGFTTQFYHDKVEVIQIEIPKMIRYDEKTRLEFIRTISNAIIKLLDDYYIFKSSKL